MGPNASKPNSALAAARVRRDFMMISLLGWGRRVSLDSAHAVTAACLPGVRQTWAATQQVERHDVARPRNSDAVERDQGHRQRLDAGHAGIVEQEVGQAG